jgi:hypothetical protein
MVLDNPPRYESLRQAFSEKFLYFLVRPDDDENV